GCLARPRVMTDRACIHLLPLLNDARLTPRYPLSLHDALPIFTRGPPNPCYGADAVRLYPELPRTSPSNSSTASGSKCVPASLAIDRKSTRLNSSHVKISYAVFCLKKKTTAMEGFSASINGMPQ